MRRSVLLSALGALPFSFLSAANAQTATGNFKPIQTLDCYKNVEPLVLDKEYDYATDGWCQQECGGMGKPVMALSGGSTCYCGDEIPPADQQVPSSNCNSPCNGYGTKMCGGMGFFQVYLTGLTTNVDTAGNGTSGDLSSKSSSATPSVVTQPGETVVVTAAAGSGGASSSGGPSKVGIAVGVVVGLIAVASIIGAIIFFLKQRKRRAIEEEHQRNAAVKDFMSSKRPETGSATDQRLDASFLSSHRRESIGSIADEMDFSRRILQVRNPDHRASQASNLA